jgi:hypothetical protein
MKLIFSLFLIFSQMAAAEEDCPTAVLSSDVSALARTISIPNCYSRFNIRKAQNDLLKPLCNACKSAFLAKLPEEDKNISQDKKQQKQEILLNIAFQEYKKSITNNLVEVAKLAALQPTGATFSQAIKSCSFKKNSAFSDCGPTSKKFLEDNLEGLQTKLANELAQILSPKELSDRTNGILNRSTTQNTCFIPEKEILFLSNSALEESLTPEIFDAISNSQAGSFEDLTDLLDHLQRQEIPNFEDIRDTLLSHPMVNIFQKDPASFIKLIKNLDPKNTEGLRKSLYSQKHGDLLDQTFAQNCDSYLKNFKEAVCSREFESGDLKLNPFKHLERIEEDFAPSTDEFVTDEALIKKNLNSFEYCEIAKKSGSLEVDVALNKISSHLGKDLASKPLKRYVIDKYEKDISALNETLCRIQSGIEKCKEGTLNCTIYKKLEALKDKNSLEYKLANSSNSEINNLLRSMIGSPRKIPTETRTILVAQGILPKNDQGEFIAQPDVPERRPGFFNQLTSNSNKSIHKSIATASAPKTTSSDMSKSQRSRDTEYSTSYAAPDMPQTPSSDYSDLLDGNSQLAEINKEIMRRLSKKSPKHTQTSSPPTKTEARKMVREIARERNYNLTPDQETALANSFMANEAGFPAIAKEDRASLDPGESESEKWKKEQKLRALSGMQGAQQTAAGRGIASVASAEEGSDANQEKNLSTVALNISEDKIKLNLLDVLNDKILKNDSEGQLLKVFLQNKKDFILQVNENSFRVNFHKASNSFKIQFDSGDTKEAQRIKPQLERFFNRLNTQVVRAKPLFPI